MSTTVSFDSLQIGEEYDRPFLAKVWGYRGIQAIARGVITPAKTNYIILFVTKEKQTSAVQYDDYIDGDMLHWQGEEKHGSDRRVLGAAKNGDEVHLFYREIHHSPFVYHGPIHLISSNLRTDEPSEFIFSLKGKVPAPDLLDDIASHAKEFKTLEQTEQTAIRKSRIGQGLFRDRLIQLWGSCSVTGISNTTLLRASHIKPWRNSTNLERLDPVNGLLLNPTLDLLFDAGLNTFDTFGRIQISNRLSTQDLGILNITPDMSLRHLPDGIDKYLDYHRSNVFSAA
jgi:putative restriction endonuclease